MKRTILPQFPENRLRDPGTWGRASLDDVSSLYRILPFQEAEKIISIPEAGAVCIDFACLLCKCVCELVMGDPRGGNGGETQAPRALRAVDLYPWLEAL